MARPSSLPLAPPALALAAGEAPAQALPIHAAPAHAQDVLPRPEPLGGYLARRSPAETRRGSAATSTLSREGGDGDARTGANGEARGKGRSRSRTQAATEPAAPVEFSEADLQRVQRSQPWWVQEADREDAAQEALLKGVRKGIPVAGGELVAYACAVGPLLLLDPKRRQARVGMEVLGEDLPDPTPAAGAEREDVVTPLLARLRPADSQLLACRYLDGQGLEAMSSTLGVSVQALRKRTGRALQRLRELVRLDPPPEVAEQNPGFLSQNGGKPR